MIQKLWKVLKNWYKGEHIPWENEPNSGLVFIGFDHKLHWSAKLLRRLVKWYLDNWKWFWTFLVAVLTLIVTIH